MNTDGTLARGSAGTSSENTGIAIGNYRVFFASQRHGLLIHGHLGSAESSATSEPGSSVVGAAVSSAGVFVTTDDSAGANTDPRFHLAVTCSDPAALALRGPAHRSGTNAENQRDDE